jgi:hypothetical protein
VPEIVADPDQGCTRQQDPIGIGEAHQQIRNSDPGERDRHQHALAADMIHKNAARHIGNRAGHVLDREDRADLRIAETEFVPDQGQQQIERSRIPMGECMADGDQPDVQQGLSRCEVGGDGGHWSPVAAVSTALRTQLP